MTRQRRWLRDALRAAVVLCSLAWAFCAADAAHARPGGGHSYDGGSSSGGSSSGGGSSGGSSDRDSGSGDSGGSEADLEAIIWLFRMTVQHPKVMLPLWVVAIAAFVARRKAQGEGWTAGGRGEAGESESPAGEPLLLRRELERLRESDPQFSVVVFEDFVQALYARVHEARGAHRLETVAPYLAEALRARLDRESEGLVAVESVVVGSMSYASVELDATDGRVRVEVDVLANYTDVTSDPPGARRGWYVAERWTLSRSRTARSRAPEAVRSFGCPSCGAPLTGLRDDACAHCGQRVTSGEFDWLLEGIDVRERSPRGPQLAGHAVERGTLAATIVDPEAKRRRDELAARDPAFTWQAFIDRVKHVFGEAQLAWSTPELARARPYLSDNLFQTWVYWIEAYREAGLRNVTEGSTVLGMRLARVTSDAYYDAITVRVRARGLDYTLDTEGRVVSGSRENLREYSEYWTLVRGAAVRGAPRADRCCPRCNAPLTVNMAGSCEHCTAHVVSGEFDWVLSRIEQDEAYQG